MSSYIGYGDAVTFDDEGCRTPTRWPVGHASVSSFLTPLADPGYSESLVQPSITLSAKLGDENWGKGAATLSQFHELARAREPEIDYCTSPDLDYSNCHNSVYKLVKQAGTCAGQRWRDFALVITKHEIPPDAGYDSLLTRRLSTNLRSRLSSIEWKKQTFQLYHLAAAGFWRYKAGVNLRPTGSAAWYNAGWYVVAADFTSEAQVNHFLAHCPGPVLARLGNLPLGAGVDSNSKPSFRYVKPALV